MPKLGSAYEQLVGAVCSALEPDADVRVNTRRLGPDGRRDMDVSIRGVRDGQPFFALIECKDWKRRVGIHVVDALHSKRDDLKADVSAIYSNSGFTKDAERKATRVGISLCSAMKSGDRRVRIIVERHLIARRLSVDSWSLAVYWDKSLPAPSAFVPHDIAFRGRPLVNWLSQKSRELVGQYPDEAHIRAEYVFKCQLEFTFKGAVFGLIGLALDLNCSSCWVCQTVREDVSLGSYDFLKRQVMVPSQQYWSLGPFDNKAWRPTDPPPSEAPLEPNSFRLGLTLLNPIHPAADGSLPELDQHVQVPAIKLSSGAA